jgi:hypothetical protein
MYFDRFNEVLPLLIKASARGFVADLALRREGIRREAAGGQRNRGFPCGQAEADAQHLGKTAEPVLELWRPWCRFGLERTAARGVRLSMSDLLLTLASLAACFWLGFQIGNVRAELQRKADIDELERRYKIINGTLETHYKVIHGRIVEAPGLKRARARRWSYS